MLGFVRFLYAFIFEILLHPYLNAVFSLLFCLKVTFFNKFACYEIIYSMF